MLTPYVLDTVSRFLFQHKYELLLKEFSERVYHYSYIYGKWTYFLTKTKDQDIWRMVNWRKLDKSEFKSIYIHKFTCGNMSQESLSTYLPHRYIYSIRKDTDIA